ncbi:MAG: hypothetical protein QOK26_3414 [Pseudonocardiales bacterium]|nr:hypothetical protein [Pseudonocardiales bacterium]
MRAACLDVAARLAAVADRWIVVAADPGGRQSMDHPVGGTFLGYGVDVPVTLAPAGSAAAGVAGVVRDDLPLPLLIAGWLRGQAAPRVVVSAELVPPDLPTEDCRRLGTRIAARAAAEASPVALLVVGDGATTHGEKSPGYLDIRAGPFDEAVAAALAGADPAGLLALDPALGLELNAVGRAPWQVLAGVVEGQRDARGDARGDTRGDTRGDRAWSGELLYSAAPFGVAYHVALWRRGQRGVQR